MGRFRSRFQLCATMAIAVSITFAHCSLAASPTTQAAVSVCFTPAERCVDAITAAIRTAQSEIRVQAYAFTSPPILKALADAKRRGVDVEIILDRVNDRDEEDGQHRTRSHYTGATFVANAGIPVWIDDTKKIAHNKVIIIDRHLVIGGSYNYSMSAEHSNVENVTFMESAEIASRFLKNWQERRDVSRSYSKDLP